jgi:peptide deformylase
MRALHVHRVTKETQAIFRSMDRLRLAENGIGIAAPQVGIMQRLCIVATEPNCPTWFMVNPVIDWLSDSMVETDEGCLSFPGRNVRVQRHTGVGVSFLDFNGHRRRYVAHRLAAIVVQHEMDHLDGITFRMRASEQTAAPASLVAQPTPRLAPAVRSSAFAAEPPHSLPSKASPHD